MSTAAIPVHVALVDETKQIDPGQLARVAGALNEQIQHDFAPVWQIKATVGAYPEAPPDTWAVRILQQLDDPNALGYHTDEGGQPLSKVLYTQEWTTTVGHEVLEMLADPWGWRQHHARLPYGLETAFAQFGLKAENSHVWYLLEVCDPPEAQSYEVGGVALSDFLLPSWYRSVPVAGRFSIAGNCKEPRQVIDGGYVSFRSPTNQEWFQVFNEGGDMHVENLGTFDKSHGSIREWTDAKARAHRGA